MPMPELFTRATLAHLNALARANVEGGEIARALRWPPERLRRVCQAHGIRINFDPLPVPRQPGLGRNIDWHARAENNAADFRPRLKFFDEHTDIAAIIASLPKRQSRVFAVLASGNGKSLSAAEIAAVLGPPMHRENVRDSLQVVREKLIPTRFRIIASTNKNTGGYRLVEEAPA